MQHRYNNWRGKKTETMAPARRSTMLVMEKLRAADGGTDKEGRAAG